MATAQINLTGVGNVKFRYLDDWQDGEPPRQVNKTATIDGGFVHQVKAMSDSSREISGTIILTTATETTLLSIYRSATLEATLEIPGAVHTGYLTECVAVSRKRNGQIRYRVGFNVISSTYY